MITFEQYCDDANIHEDERTDFSNYLTNKGWNLMATFSSDDFNMEYDNFIEEGEEIEDEDEENEDDY